MLLLQFFIEHDRFAFDSGKVVEITPVVPLRAVPNAPPGLAGLMNFRGEVLPVIDVSQALVGRKARLLMSTRIVLARLWEKTPQERVVGLLVEKATETFFASRDQFQSPKLDVQKAPYLGDVMIDSNGMIQLLEIEKMLPRDLATTIFPKGEENGR